MKRTLSVSPTAGSPASKQRRADEPERGSGAGRNSDSEMSDSSEVLSVGNDPPPTLVELERADGGSRSASPASSDSCHPGSTTVVPSPPISSSPGASSVRSPTSSSVTASSPGRSELGPELPRYPVHLLKYPEQDGYAGRLLELGYAGQIHRTPISMPVLTRLSLSPPSALTVPGLQVNTPMLHPTASAHPLGHALGHLQQAVHQVGPVASTLLHQQQHHHHQQQQQQQHQQQQPQQQQQQQQPHRLSVSKILQRESPTSPRQLSNGVARCANTSDNHVHNPTNNNNNNINNNTQHQANLKFSIDNILKADFGRRITDPISLKNSRPKKPIARPIDLSKDFIESSSEGSERGSERGSETSTRNVSPSLPVSSPAPNAHSAPGAEPKLMQWPAWVYCTRYSDRPSSGPRTRRPKRTSKGTPLAVPEEKRPRTAFSAEQLSRLRKEFTENKYLNEQRRQTLSKELGLNEAQIKIWFQNKRAKIKKASGQKNPLALQLMAQGLYNHSTVPLTKEEMEQAERAELQAN